MILVKTMTLLSLLFVADGCTKEADTEIAAGPKPAPNDGKPVTGWWKPPAGISFDWNLGVIGKDDVYSTDVVDVDAFETSGETVAALHAQGKKVIA